MLKIFVDGLCEPVNPGGIACFGYVIYEGDSKLTENCGVVDTSYPTNNVAEYTAAIEALLWVQSQKRDDPITIFSDSQLLVYQMNGFYSVSAPRIIPLYKKLSALLKNRKVKFRWIPREKNQEADNLSRRAYDKYLVDNPRIFERFRSNFATDKQKALLERLKIPYPVNISKREASKLISERLNKLKGDH